MVIDGVVARARAVGRALLGPRRPELIARLIHADRRWPMFDRAVEYINYEAVPGDILEFGVFGGLSLVLLAKAASFDPKGNERRIAGFDSFEGLPPAAESHARWRPGDCATIEAPHPLLAPGARVTAAVVEELFARCALPPPHLHVGSFEDTVPQTVTSEHSRVALAHIDCDLYESTRTVLEGIADALQDGTVLLFDDWYHYKAHPRRGEARAFQEFLEEHPEWCAVSFGQYGVFCHAFVLSKR